MHPYNINFGVLSSTPTSSMGILSENLHQTVPLTPDEKTKIEHAFKQVHYAKGDLWVKQGKVCNQVAFVVKGKLRIFYLDDAGNEITCYFVTADHFISSFTSFLTNTPTTENISAIEDTTLMVISKTDLEKLSEEIPKIHIWRRIIAENLFITMEKRVSMLQSQTAHERYENMLKENPEIILSVPLQYTASFLGITPQHLSRLRKESAK
jgi:CRP-like cAMP-binding protein